MLKLGKGFLPLLLACGLLITFIGGCGSSEEETPVYLNPDGSMIEDENPDGDADEQSGAETGKQGEAVVNDGGEKEVEGDGLEEKDVNEQDDALK